uniref:Protein phosphatase 1 regulatory subunit 17 n=1 Tax=Leptobrachium leishanense TaxID=445787 RepID=A0A8C5MY21_9ANUR
MPCLMSDILIDKKCVFNILTENLSEHLIRGCDVHMKTRQGNIIEMSQKNELEKKQPRRKDTPALNMAPFIPGRLIKPCDMVDMQKKSKAPVHNKEQELSKPRRKDTPALQISPLHHGKRKIEYHCTQI